MFVDPREDVDPDRTDRVIWAQSSSMANLLLPNLAVGPAHYLPRTARKQLLRLVQNQVMIHPPSSTCFISSLSSTSRTRRREALSSQSRR